MHAAITRARVMYVILAAVAAIFLGLGIAPIGPAAMPIDLPADLLGGPRGARRAPLGGVRRLCSGAVQEERGSLCREQLSPILSLRQCCFGPPQCSQHLGTHEPCLTLPKYGRRSAPRWPPPRLRASRLRRVPRTQPMRAPAACATRSPGGHRSAPREAGSFGEVAGAQMVAFEQCGFGQQGKKMCLVQHVATRLAGRKRRSGDLLSATRITSEYCNMGCVPRPHGGQGHVVAHLKQEGSRPFEETQRIGQAPD